MYLPATATHPTRPPVVDFALPPQLEAGAPAEARGLARDEVRLLISYRADDRLLHARFRDLPRFLAPGDVLVINTSGTLNAAVPARRPDGSHIQLHFSTPLPGGGWSVELRRPAANDATRPLLTARAGETLRLPAGAQVRLIAPLDRPGVAPKPGRVRLWRAGVDMTTPLPAYLARHGRPIRYSYVKQSWPGSYYQTVYADEMGSAEMPSAGRAFTPELITRLVSRGVQVVPLLLHTGVASLEDHEPPYAEPYRVPAASADAINLAQAAGRRVIAVGTTVVRALETVTDAAGRVHPGSGWTELIITPDRPLRAVDGMLTGLHEPKASHLAMLNALAPRRHLRRAYQAALAEGYLWHEFGDLHLIL